MIDDGNITADDGSDKPIGYVSPDGHLEVREFRDEHGNICRGYHETELGQHDRWLRQAPDLFEKYQDLLSRVGRASVSANSAATRPMSSAQKTKAPTC